MPQHTNNLASESWAIADLLRGDFKQSQYGRIILPFCLLRRLECVLAPTKDAVLAEAAKIQALNLPEDAQEKLLLRATKTLDHYTDRGIGIYRKRLRRWKSSEIKPWGSCWMPNPGYWN